MREIGVGARMQKKISGAAGDMGKAREERNLLAEFT